MVTPRDASPSTIAAHTAASQQLAFDDVADVAAVKYRGFVAPLPNEGLIVNAGGQTVWDLPALAWIEDDAPPPPTVHPSLWRQSQLIRHAGLFEVSERIYQIRNHDIANVTIIEGDDALIVMDPGTVAECTQVAMDLYFEHRPRLPVAAVIYTHTHLDHFGGVLGAVSPDEVAAGRAAVIAPGDDFNKHAYGENLIAGNAMGRRAGHPFGGLLPPCATGFISDGIGLNMTKAGNAGYIRPTDTIRTTGETRTIAGLTFVFQMAKDTEAPEEFHFYIPELKALTCAENANHSMHNIQTLRGACPATPPTSPATSTRPSSCSAATSRCTTARTPGRCGATTASSNSSHRNATPTNTSTTRHCDWPTTDSTPSRSAKPSTPAVDLRGVVEPGLPRHAETQRARRLPQGARLLRRQPRQPRPAPARRIRRAVGGSRRRCRQGRRRRP